MERLKKIMTVMAIAGTVLVTALFCYMPIRHLLQEKNKQEISLSPNDGSTEVVQENGVQDGEEQVQANGEGFISDESEGFLRDEENEVFCLGENTLQTQVLLSVKSKEQEIVVSLWQSSDGVGYFFLPGFAKEAEITLAGVGEASLLGDHEGSILFDDTQIREGDILTDIMWDTPYAATIYEDGKAEGISLPVVFMCSSDLPVLAVTTESGNMTYIDEEKGNEEPGEIYLLDESGEVLYAGEAEGIRGRGNSTWGLLKKPYQFKLKEVADLFGFGKGKSWVLLANGYDETNLRNQIALELAKKLEMNYVPQGRLVDVYINEEYYGCYFLCEKIGVGENQVDIRNLEEKTSLVYREEERNNLSVSENEEQTRRFTDVAYEEPDISGGYLFERELKERYAEESSGFVTSQGDHYALQSPKYASEEQVNYIGDLMQEFQDALERKDGIHPVTGRHYSEYIDVTSFVQKYLVEEISKNYDGGVTSSFFYKPQDEVSTKIFAGPVWDYDVAFGNCNLDRIASNPIGITKLNDHIYATGIFAQLYEKEEFYEQIVSLYEEKALPYLDSLVEGGIDEMAEETKQASLMNHLRWEELSNRYQYYEVYENDVKYLKYFIEARRDFLNEVWLEGAVYHKVVYLVEGEPYKIDYVKEGELIGREPVPYKENALFAGWYTEKGSVPFDEYKPIYEDMTFAALWQELAVGEADAESGNG